MPVLAQVSTHARAAEGGTHERIRAAALACIARWGVAKTTLDDVARVAGLSRATVYRAFPGGRDALMTAVADAQVVAVMAAVARSVEGAATLEDALVAGMTSAGEWVRDDAALQYLLANEPESVLPQLCFDGLDRLLGTLTDFASPLLAPWLGSGTSAAAEGAEWAARIFLSHLVWPADDVDLSDESSVRRLVRQFVLPGLANNEGAS